VSARTKARKRAVDVLFEAAQRRVDAVTLLSERVREPGTQSPLPQYAVEVVEGVHANLARIDETIASLAQGWTLERMPAVDLAILRVGVWEILCNEQVDDAVAIDEAVELAASLSTDDSPAFVNGLLGRVSRLKDTL
jgi:transcription antitermination factor NusB